MHPSTASVPVTVLLYDGPLLCGFNVATKGLNHVQSVMNNFSNILKTVSCVETIKRHANGFFWRSLVVLLMYVL